MTTQNTKIHKTDGCKANIVIYIYKRWVTLFRINSGQETITIVIIKISTEVWVIVLDIAQDNNLERYYLSYPHWAIPTYWCSGPDYDWGPEIKLKYISLPISHNIKKISIILQLTAWIVFSSNIPFTNEWYKIVNTLYLVLVCSIANIRLM